MFISNSLIFSPTAILKSLEKEAPEVEQNLCSVKESLIKIATSKEFPNIFARDQALVEFASSLPGVKEKLQKILDLKAQYPFCVKAVQEKSWLENCEERGLMMTRPYGEEKISLEEFRTLWNAAVDEVSIAIGKEAGCAPASWGSCGTVSAFSDVDNNILGKNLSPSDANIFVTMRYAVHSYALEGHSGIQLDTEAYIPHAAKYDTASSLSDSRETYSAFLACEKANVALQYHLSLNDFPDDYQKAKNSYLENISLVEHREGMREIFSQSERLMNYLETEIHEDILREAGVDFASMSEAEKNDTLKRIKEKDPKAYKLARENVITRLRTQMGEAIDRIDRRIASIQKRISADEEEYKREIESLDRLHISRNVMFSVMNIMQDKGTNSQAEGKVTLLFEGGQLHASEFKKAEKLLALEEEKKTGVHKHVGQTNWGTICEILYKYDLREKLTPKGYRKAGAETLCIAAHEENVQRKHVFIEEMRHVSSDKEALKAIGHSKQAKYAQRVTTNSYRAIQAKIQEFRSNGKPIPKALIQLKQRAKKLMITSEALLRCMRKDYIGIFPTIELLKKSLPKSPDPVVLRAKVEKVASLFEPGGREYGRPIQKFEKVNHMIEEMKRLGLIEPKNILTVKQKSTHGNHSEIHFKLKNVELHKILEARAGYPIDKAEHADLIPIHDEALYLTCKELKLETVKDVSHFDQEVDQLYFDLENLFLVNGWMPIVTKKIAAQLEFLETLRTQATPQLTQSPS
ncbi:MAG: hypothetical protein JJU12_06405 [Chlamydiales bacterium]|nr:hypothetical protein [Chlamydiales bacterium]